MIAETYSTRRCLETHHQLGCDRRNRELATANHVGPLLLPVTVATLVTLIILGYALLYWPHLPAGFNVDEKAQSARGIEALYFSGITFTTLGYGDIAPRSTPMRLLALSEALTGFGFISLAVTYLVSLTAALERNRTAALPFYHRARRALTSRAS